MDCYAFKSNMFAFREGSLSEELHHSSLLHLESCMACSRLLTKFNDLDAIIAQDKAAEPNPFAATRLQQRIENEFERPKSRYFPGWIRVLQPVAIAFALLCGILIGSYTAKKDNSQANQMVNTLENIEFLRSNLFISEFADEDRILVLNN